MQKFIKKGLKKLLKTTGYKISKINSCQLQADNPFLAAKKSILSKHPVLFDVGMNHGQTLDKMLQVYPKSNIHGFEPSKNCFKLLKERFALNNVVLNNVGLADKVGTLQFNEYSWDAMNSFLKRAYGKTHIVDNYDVEVTTIDAYVKANKIDHIHILKSDTEGFELKVLKGAENLLDQNKVQFIYLELFFDLNFIGQSSVGTILSYLESKNFSLVRFYDFTLTADGLASKADALFINKQFKKEH